MFSFSFLTGNPLTCAHLNYWKFGAVFHYCFPIPFFFLSCSISSLCQALFFCPSERSNISGSWSSLRNKVKLVFMGLYLAWLCRTSLILYKTTLPAFFCKDKMFFVSYCVVIWQEHHKDFSYLFWQSQRGLGQTSLLKKLWWGFVHLWFDDFYTFSKLFLGLRPCI